MRIPLLRAYYLLRRGLNGPLDPGVQRMREFRDEFYRRVWQEAAEQAGARWSACSAAVADIVSAHGRLRVSNNVTSLDDPATLLLAGDKPAVYRLLAKSGVVVPRHVVLAANRADRLERTLNTIGPPLVVKPATDTGSGHGVSTNVMTRRQLRHAFAWACAHGQRVLIERQIEGHCFRVLILDGEVLDTVKRRRVSFVGDGRSTIRSLIARENALRLESGTERAQVLIRRDPDLGNTLLAQGLRLRSRPRAGARIELKRVVNDNGTDENEAACGVLCPAILHSARRAAQAVGLRLAGVDIICRDASVPLEQSGGAVIEVNATPGFHYHYHRRGERCEIAAKILEAAFGHADRAATVHAL
ncbi:MAG: hypothetical protein ACREFQ_13580 [Stellaceae bacterium]